MLLSLAAGIAAAIVTLAITRSPGPGLDPDSASYLGAAQSLARGRGYRIPIASWASSDSTAPLAHFPPGYPTTLALPLSFGVAPLQSARFVNAAAAFVDVALATWLVTLAAGQVAAAALAIALLLMPAFLEQHIPVLSEPLFLACLVATLTTLYAAANARSQHARRWWSFASGCTSTAAVMVRYVGISACAASTLWSLLLPGTRRERARRALLTMAPWLLLCVLWVLRTHHLGGGSAIRRIGAYGDLGVTLREGVATVVAWLVPLSPDDTLPGRRWFALTAAALLVAAVAAGLRREYRLTSERPGIPSATPPSLMIVAAGLLLALLYAVVLCASRSLADPAIPFDERLLLPLFVLAAVVAAITVRSWWRGASVVTRVLCAVLVLGWIAASYHVSSDDVDWAMENGYDLAGDPWRSSALIQWARENATGRPLYSNWPTAVVLQLGRSAHDAPTTVDTVVLREFVSAVHAHNGVILAFDTQAPDMIGADVLLHAPGLERIAQLSDGSVFVAVPVATPSPPGH